MDAVQAADSGHPGMPMGMADIAEVLWNDYLKHNPGNPRWYDRDRFVLSNGHGSMLLYSLLHLTGYPLPLEELRNFRQLGSRTPGHPERDPDLGIETTTGPLGQGLGNAVGMAAQNQIVVINKGTADGIESGHVLSLLKSGGQVQDRTQGKPERIKLPDERSGLLMVFRPFERLSYALVLEASDGAKVGDRVANPD